MTSQPHVSIDISTLYMHIAFTSEALALRTTLGIYT